MPTQYEDRTLEELMELAQERDVLGRSSMTKEELIAALRGESTRHHTGGVVSSSAKAPVGGTGFDYGSETAAQSDKGGGGQGFDYGASKS